MAANLLAAMREVTDPPICYAPYNWYVDQSGANAGICDPADATSNNRFSDWTPALMKAAHNYQLNVVDPGAYAHNFDYMGQLLYDSTVDLAGDGGAMVRP